MKMNGVELEVGMMIRQTKALVGFGFDFVGKEFIITEIYEDVVKAKGTNVMFGATQSELEEYFELVLPDVEEEEEEEEEDAVDTWLDTDDIGNFTTEALLSELKQRTVSKGLGSYSNMELLKELRHPSRNNIKVIHTYGLQNEQIFTIIVN